MSTNWIVVKSFLMTLMSPKKQTHTDVSRVLRMGVPDLPGSIKQGVRGPTPRNLLKSEVEYSDFERSGNNNLLKLYGKVIPRNLNNLRIDITLFQLIYLLIFVLTVRLFTDNEKYVYGIF